MKKKVLLFFAMAMLSVMGAKADVIPSSYYSEPAAGDFYLYNVNQGQFLDRLDSNFPTLTSTPVKFTLAVDGTGYTIKYTSNTVHSLHTGYWNNQYLWVDAGNENSGYVWTFDAIGGLTKTYQLKRTEEETQERKTGTFYANGTNADTSPTDDCQWALITESDYNKYYYTNLVDRDSSIPSSFFTTTPTAGTYYLYNIEKNGFIYDGANYVGLGTTPTALTLTSDGNGAFYIQVPDNGYVHTGFAKIGNTGYHVWADGATTTASGDYAANWTFESFYGVSGVFFVKSPETTVNGITGNWHLHATGIANNGVNAWPTPDANRTNYAWALISEANYTAWQNSFTLNESTDFSIARDIYNVNPTVTKSMTANVWNTFVVPFDMDIPSGWTVKEPTDFDGSTLFFSNASSIVAGKPYIVKPTEAVTSFSATGVTLKKDLEPTTVGEGTTVTMTGTYSKIDAIVYSTQTSYVIGIKDGVSSLYKVNSDVSLKPFRAYFTIPGVSSARIALSFDDETTGIKNLTPALSEGEGAVYDLQGRRVAQPTKGLYIVNGKKVMVK